MPAPGLSDQQNELLDRILDNGDTSAIEQAGRNALARLHPSDVSLLAQAFVQALMGDTPRPVHGQHPQMSDNPEVMTPAMLAAVRGFDGLFLKDAFWRAPDNELFETICFGFRKLPKAWTVFRMWIREKLKRCVRAPHEHRKIIQMLDRLFHIFMAPMKRAKEDFSEDKELLSLFTAVWILDVELDQPSVTAPSLVYNGILLPKEFALIVGGSAEELVSICQEHLELAHCHFLSSDRSLWHLGGMVELIHSLISSKDKSFLSYALSRGITPFFCGILFEVFRYGQDALHLRKALVGRPLVTKVMTKLMLDICSALACGPQFIIQAVDAHIIELAKSTVVLWYYEDSGTNHDFGDLKVLQLAIERCFTIIRQHVYHKRVIRHLIRNRAQYEAKSPPRFMEVVPWASTWNTTLDQITTAFAIDRRYQAERPFHACLNMNCPRQASLNRGRGLKECSRCLRQTVCSERCQRALWPKHQKARSQINLYASVSTSTSTTNSLSASFSRRIRNIILCMKDI